jgi:carbamoyl-phosphate synthase small subunit
VVFNTAITGYQEILTDPSYCQQIVTLTYPHIGNYGVNAEDIEADKVHAAGLIIKDLPLLASNFRATRRCRSTWCAKARSPSPTSTPASSPACCAPRARRTAASWPGRRRGRHASRHRPRHAAAKAAPSMAGLDLTAPGYGEDARVSMSSPTTSASSATSCACWPSAAAGHRGAGADAAAEVLALQPDGVFLSNGPGDPEPCDYAIAAIRELIDTGIPTFGICLGHQIMALASGAKTFKMKFGHHGANHPVKDLDTGRVQITSQNHGFAVDERPCRQPARHPRQPVRRHAAGHGPHRQAGLLLPGPPGSLAPARTTSPTCSTASSI